jgi:hypothetical protein
MTNNYAVTGVVLGGLVCAGWLLLILLLAVGASS